MNGARSRFGIGQPVRRVEDARFLGGQGRYLDDFDLPRQAFGQIVLSPHAHAHIRGIDADAARQAPGVLCVLTGADIVAAGLGALPPLFMPEDTGGPKGYRAMRPILVQDRVRHVGDRIAFVVAETAAQARDAAELIAIDYEPLPAVVHIGQAVAEDAAQVWEGAPGNTCFALAMGDKQATDAAFAKAPHRVKLRLENNRLAANSLEPRGAIGEYRRADDGYTLFTSTQNPHGVRSVLAQAVFHIPEASLRVVAPDVGGGFGMKGDVYPEEALVLLASRQCGRPVKWIATRSEALLSDDHGRDQVVEAEMALDRDGRILAIRAAALHNVGAYIVGAAVVPIVYSLKLIPSVYDVPAIHLASRAVFTNTAPTGPYRGAGRPEAIYLTERLMDRAAEELGMDPVELRRRNYLAPDTLPRKTATGLVYDSGDFARTTELCLVQADWAGYAERAAASRGAGKLRGRSVAYYIQDCGVFNERMELRTDPSGGVTIVAGTFSHGQSHATTYAQMAAEWLGVPFETIRLIQGDTHQVSFGRGTYASRSVTLGGSALKAAADALVEKGKALAAHLLEASAADITFGAGRYEVAGTDRAISFIDVAKASYRPAGLPRELGLGLDASGTHAGEPPSFPNGCHVCEVEVDPETGTTTIARYVVADDLGRLVNPLIVGGQIHGGLTQGIGQALMEHAVYDGASGQLLSGSFIDYAMPRADQLPPFDVSYNEVPCRTNPLGVKGAGEAGSVGAPPAVINAVLDALRPLGVRHIDMPATPCRVWQAIRAAQAAS